MKDVQKLLLKAKRIGLSKEHISEITIDRLEHCGKIDYTLLCCLVNGKNKRYIREMYFTKEGAIDKAKQLISQYPSKEEADFLDWSIVPQEKWEELSDADGDEDRKIELFSKMKQQAVISWQDVNN